MRKLILIILITFMFPIWASIGKTDAADTLSPMQTAENSLSDYHWMFVNQDNGIYKYSGTNDILKLNFSSDDREVLKIDMAISLKAIEDNPDAIAAEIARVIDILIPNSSKSGPIKYKIAEQFRKIAGQRSQKSFKIGRLKYQAKTALNLLYLEITN